MKRGGFALPKKILPAFLFTAMIAVVFLAGSQTHAAEPVLSDQSIGDTVQSELRKARGDLASKIYVVTKNGVVILAGEVDHILTKERAVGTAQMVEGVRAVVDLIRIVPPYLLEDEKIREGVMDALLHNPATGSSPIKVSVSANVVTLSGTVDSWQRKYLAEELAKGVRGVVAVDNRLTIHFDKERRRPDLEIKTDVEQVLERDALLDHESIQVEVKGGAVTLSGYVESEPQKNRVVLNAYVTGVTSVDSRGLKVKASAGDPKLRKTRYLDKSDAEILDAVQEALLLDPRVISSQVYPRVSFGIVTLYGQVDNATAKQASEEDARHTVGVRRVENRLEVDGF